MKKIVLSCLVYWLIGSGLSAQQALSLQECRDLAVRNNKELQVSAEKIKIAGYEKKAALTKYFPQLSANGAYMWNQKDLNLLDMGQLSSSLASSLGGLAELPIVQQAVGAVGEAQHLDVQNIWVGNIALVQPIFMGGKIVSYNQIAEYAKELAISMNDQQLQDLLYKTDETYWQVVSLVNKKKLADAYVDLLRKMDEDVTAMIKEGIATEADGLSVKVKLNEAEMAQTQVNNGLALSRMLLAQICGLPLDKPLSLADEELDTIPVSTETASADINQAFMNRNELRSLDLASKIYKKKERIVLADMLPTVAFSANYLVTKGVRVVVIDCDFQHSIMKCRKADIRKYGEQEMPYEVWAYEANDKAMMTSLMEKLHNDPEIDVVLMDSPGSLKAEGLIPMFVNSDIIIVPFHYDLVTVPSTASFLMFVDRLKKAVGERMKARLFIIPNLNDGRIGKRSELLIWDNARDTFSNYGYVTAKIPKRADMERFSTMAALDMQAAIVTPVFDKVYQGIFDTLEPIREKELKGIQLTENLNSKPKKKKKAQPSNEASQDSNENQNKEPE